MAAAMNTAAASVPTGQAGGGLVPSSPFSVPLDSPPKLAYGLVVVLLIVFVDQVPAYMRDVTDSFFGRLVGVGLVLGATLQLGWSYGLLTAVAVLLLMRGARRLSAVADRETDTSPLMALLGIGGPKEGFQAQQVAEAVGNRWYVERVLGEQPLGIITTTADTMAVQDLSQKNMGSRK
jgi:hypothetical protein